MGYRYEISDVDWNRIKDVLPGQPGQHGGIAEDNRRFLNAVLWIARTGAPWRDLPARLGNWNSQWRRFDRWAAKGRFAKIVEELRDPDLDVMILDSTVIRAHPCAAGAKKNGTVAAVRTIKPWVAVEADSARRFTGVSTDSAIPSC
jgi:transposase